MTKNQLLSRLRAKGHITEEEYQLLKEERPQGEWILHSTYKGVLICSNCKHGSNQVYGTFNFCPNCGADMRKEAENDDT